MRTGGGREVLLAEAGAEVELDVAGDRGEGEVVGVDLERVVELLADRVEAEEGVGDQDRDGGGEPLQGVDEAEGEREAVDADDLVDQDPVDVGERGGADALAAALHVGHLGEAGLEEGDVVGVDEAAVVGVAHDRGEVGEDRLGTVGLADEGLGEGRVEELVVLGEHVLVAQALAQGVAEGDDVVDEAAAQLREGLGGGGVGL